MASSPKSKEPDEKGTTEVSPGAGGTSQDVSSAGGGAGQGQTIPSGQGAASGQPISDDVKTPLPSDDESEEAPVSTQMTPIPGVPEGRPRPEDWTPPGDHIKGMYPGDPNVYPDPENPTSSY